MDNLQGVIPPPSPAISPEIPPQVQEAEIVSQSEPEPKKEEEEPKHKYKLVRGSGDPVYIITNDKKRHWVLNPLILQKLGYKFGEEEKITPAELAAIMPGEPITFENWEKYA